MLAASISKLTLRTVNGCWDEAVAPGKSESFAKRNPQLICIKQPQQIIGEGRISNSCYNPVTCDQ